MNLGRLRQMSKDELQHRLREQIRRKADQMRFRAGIDLKEDRELDALIERHGSSLKSYLQHGPARRFYASSQDREGTSHFVSSRYPEWLERTIHQAGILCEHRVTLLGHTDIA